MADRSPSRNPSRPAARVRLTADEWRELNVRILNGIDVKSAAESMGARFTGRKTGDRLICHAVDRVEKGAHDSAAFNVGTGKFRGHYYDFGGAKLSMSLWDFGAKYGGFADWEACRRHFAGVARIPYPDTPEFVRPARAPRTPSRPLPPRVDTRVRENIGEQLDKLHAWAMKTGALTRLAVELHVHKDALIAQRVGFAPLRPGRWEYNLYDPDTKVSAAALIFPEAQVIGLKKPQRQSADRRGLGNDTRKQALPNRPRGLTISHDWHVLAKSSGQMFIICEGATDTAAIYSMGLGVLGIPMKGYCAEDVAVMIARAHKKGVFPAATPITVMVDRDKTGFASTERLAQYIANALGRPVAGRFAPSVRYRPMLHPMDWEFPAERYPFLHDETDPRWLTLKERKGVAKDTREWLGWVADADRLGLDARLALGRRFAAELEFAFDVSPEVVAPAPTCVAPAVMEEGGVEIVYSLSSKDMVLDAGGHKTISTPPVPPKPPAAPAPPLSPLSKLTLPRNLTCPKPSVVFLGEKRRIGHGAYCRIACGCFNCVACCSRRRSDWGYHLEERFRHMLTPLPSHFWRGPVADMARITRRVRKKFGEYASIIVPGGQAVVIATQDFPGATPIDLAGATREMVDAVLSVEYRPGIKHKRYRPINASRNWKLPGRGTGTGDYISLSRRFRNPKVSLKIAEDMGVITHDKSRPFAPCEFPAAWTRRDQKLAGLWAAMEVYPAGYVKGTSPVPDVAAVASVYLALPFAPPPLPKPKKLTARERKAAERLAKFAATPGLFDVP